MTFAECVWVPLVMCSHDTHIIGRWKSPVGDALAVLLQSKTVLRAINVRNATIENASNAIPLPQDQSFLTTLTPSLFVRITLLVGFAIYAKLHSPVRHQATIATNAAMMSATSASRQVTELADFNQPITYDSLINHEIFVMVVM